MLVSAITASKAHALRQKKTSNVPNVASTKSHFAFEGNDRVAKKQLTFDFFDAEIFLRVGDNRGLKLATAPLKIFEVKKITRS